MSRVPLYALAALLLAVLAGCAGSADATWTPAAPPAPASASTAPIVGSSTRPPRTATRPALHPATATPVSARAPGPAGTLAGTVVPPAAPATPQPRPTPSPVPSDPTHYSLTLAVDTTQQHAISPLIYGVADSGAGHEDRLGWLGVTLVRWGGNARTMHNWEINASNAGEDWEFRNLKQGDAVPGSASLQFVQRNARLGAGSLLTIPTIGWVARDAITATASQGVPAHGGPPVAPGSSIAFTDLVSGKWVHPYDPAANRARTSLPSLPRKGAPFAYPPDLTDGLVYQDEWAAYLRSQRPAGQPAPIYAMDNEPELWADSTHVDVHPVRPGYDDLLQTFLAYARAVKDADPAGLVAGPESWGVTGYLYSALDEGGDRFATGADRVAHGGLPWLAWFLQTTQAADKAADERSLDVLSVHYYPNGGEYSGGDDPAMQDSRMQAPRALWDGLFTEPGWVGRTEWANVALLRRLHKLIDQYYPGTRVGISEWNYGGEDDISGAIATADALGIYGREDVYYATYWLAPPQGSPSGWAFRLYRNYDGQGATFGSIAVAVDGGDGETSSAYGALDRAGRRLTLLVINKDRTRTADMVIRPGSFIPTGAREYRYSEANLEALVPGPLALTDPAAVRVIVPPMAITLVVLDGSAEGGP